MKELETGRGFVRFSYYPAVELPLISHDYAMLKYAEILRRYAQ